MSTAQRTMTTMSATDVARARAAFGSNAASVTCWLPIYVDTKPVTIGLHRSRRLRRPSP